MQLDRFQIARREAIYSLLLTALYFICWVISAYFTPPTKSLMGMPLWFVLSCILFPIGFMILITLVARFLFTELPLGDHYEN